MAWCVVVLVVVFIFLQLCVSFACMYIEASHLIFCMPPFAGKSASTRRYVYAHDRRQATAGGAHGDAGRWYMIVARTSFCGRTDLIYLIYLIPISFATAISFYCCMPAGQPWVLPGRAMGFCVDLLLPARHAVFADVQNSGGIRPCAVFLTYTQQQNDTFI